MVKRIYTPCKDCIYEIITDRTIYYMKKYHGFDIIKTYFKPADFHIGECDVANIGVIWCDKPGKNNTKLIDERKIITTTTWLKEQIKKAEQVTPFGVDDELAQKHVNFDFNARKGYITTDSDILKMFEGRRKQLTFISNNPNADFQFMNISENLKYYLLSHSLFYITIGNKEGFDIFAIEAMSVGTPLVYMRNNTHTEYECGVEIDSVEELRKIEISKEEWEDLSYKCWFKSLRYHYITIGQELWGWFE